jgi:hypothetical protein
MGQGVTYGGALDMGYWLWAGRTPADSLFSGNVMLTTCVRPAGGPAADRGSALHICDNLACELETAGGRTAGGDPFGCSAFFGPSFRRLRLIG